MYLAMILLPLLSSISSGFFGRKIGVAGSHIIACLSIVISTIISVFALLEVGINNIQVCIKLFTWIDSELLNVL